MDRSPHPDQELTAEPDPEREEHPQRARVEGADEVFAAEDPQGLDAPAAGAEVVELPPELSEHEMEAAERPLHATLLADARSALYHLAPHADVVPDAPRYVHYSVPVRQTGKRVPTARRVEPLLIAGRRVSALAIVLLVALALVLFRLVS